MLHWFPTPYPDELLYSVFARYHVRSGNTSPKITTEELFGTRSIRSVWDLPANLDALLNRLGTYWKPDDLILKHTMFPYYASFLLPKQREKVKRSMVANRGNTIHTRAGIAASNVKQKTNLWVCSACINEDMDTYGETYWHRIHQAPGVFICPQHETVLEETKISVKAYNQHEYIVASPDFDRKKAELNALNKDDIILLSQVAHATETLLEESNTQRNTNTIRNKYLVLLKQKGLASPNGYLKRKRLYKMFSSMLTYRCLDLLQSPVYLEETNWLTMIFQKHRQSYHPLRHILIMLFLETDLDHLFDKAKYLPFGRKPYHCLNTSCTHYRKRVITSLKVTRCCDTKKPVGTFHCNRCGFVFSRRGPDENKVDRYRIGTIKDYGVIWKDKLKTLVNEGKLLKDIAKELQADTATVKKYAEQMDLKVPWKAPRTTKMNKKEKMEKEEVLLAVKKERWLEIQQRYPEKTNLQRLMLP
jgi:Tn7-like transposition protein D/TniQ